MALIVYNRENFRPQEVTYKGKRTINLDSRGTVYLSKTMSIELGILGGGRVNFAHDDETGDYVIRLLHVTSASLSGNLSADSKNNPSNVFSSNSAAVSFA